MAINVTWRGVVYPIPVEGEENWPNLTSYLVSLGQNASTNVVADQAIRVSTEEVTNVSAANDFAVVIDRASPGASTVNLPVGIEKRLYLVLDGKGDAKENNITINPNGAETINGAASLVLNRSRQSVLLQFLSGDWKILSLSRADTTNYIQRSADPATGSNGETYYNTTTHRVRIYSEGIWKNLDNIDVVVFADDAAYEAANPGFGDGSFYLNSSTGLLRQYFNGTWTNSVSPAAENVGTKENGIPHTISGSDPTILVFQDGSSGDYNVTLDDSFLEGRNQTLVNRNVLGRMFVLANDSSNITILNPGDTAVLKCLKDNPEDFADWIVLSAEQKLLNNQNLSGTSVTIDSSNFFQNQIWNCFELDELVLDGSLPRGAVLRIFNESDTKPLDVKSWTGNILASVPGQSSCTIITLYGLFGVINKNGVYVAYDQKTPVVESVEARDVANNEVRKENGEIVSYSPSSSLNVVLWDDFDLGRSVTIVNNGTAIIFVDAENLQPVSFVYPGRSVVFKALVNNPDKPSEWAVIGSSPEITCSVYRSNFATGLSTGSPVVMPFNTKLYDIHDLFNTSNHRFAPLIPGLYKVSVQAILELSANRFRSVVTMVVKNGSNIHSLSQDTDATSSENKTVTTARHETIVQLNGSTDYIDIRGLITPSGTATWTLRGLDGGGISSQANFTLVSRL